MRITIKMLMGLAIAGLTALLLTLAMPRSAEAAPMTTAISGAVRNANPSLSTNVYYYRGFYGGGYGFRRGFYRPRYYGYRPVYYGYRPAYYGYRPVYYGRRCFLRSRVVYTPWGPRRRVVRVCRW